MNLYANFFSFFPVKKPWSTDEKASVLLFFKLLNKNNFNVPGKEACEKCIRNSEGILRNRSWRDVKYYVYNYIKKTNKKTKSETKK